MKGADFLAITSNLMSFWGECKGENLVEFGYEDEQEFSENEKRSPERCGNSKSPAAGKGRICRSADDRILDTFTVGMESDNKNSKRDKGRIRQYRLPGNADAPDAPQRYLE
jgi:hypothetical protein